MGVSAFVKFNYTGKGLSFRWNALKTCLQVMFPAQAKGNISEIVEKMRTIGFAPVTGEYDFEFLWTKSPGIDEIAALGNNVQKVLKDTGVMFKLETVSDNAFL